MFRREFLSRSAAGLVAAAIGSQAEYARSFTPNPHGKVRIALIGLRHSHAEGKLAALLDLKDDFDLVGVVESNEGRRESIQKRPHFQNIHWLSEKEALASDADAVVVETAVSDLVPIARRCIDANKHVHLEKPGGPSRDAYVRLFDDARRRGRHIQVGYMLRHNPAFEFCFRAVRDGWLGRVFEVTGSMSKLVDDRRRPEFGEYSGGAMFELGCHVIDALLTVLGPPSKVTPFNRATRGDGVLDSQTAVFEYSDAIATVRSSIVEPHGGDRRHFEVSGENGTITIRPLEPPKLQLALERSIGGFQAGTTDVEIPFDERRYHKQLQEFAAIVRGDKQPEWSAKHDLAVQLAVLQASGMPTDG